jgi:hypothetical protein
MGFRSQFANRLWFVTAIMHLTPWRKDPCNCFMQTPFHLDLFACRSYCVVRLTAEQNYRSKKPLLIQTVEKKKSLKQLCVQKQPFFGTATNLGPCVGGSESAASYCVCRFFDTQWNIVVVVGDCKLCEESWGSVTQWIWEVNRFCLKSRLNLLKFLLKPLEYLRNFFRNSSSLWSQPWKSFKTLDWVVEVWDNHRGCSFNFSLLSPS